MPYKTISWEKISERIEAEGKIGRELLRILEQHAEKGLSVTFYYKGDKEPDKFDLEENLTEKEKDKDWDWSSIFDSFLLPPTGKKEFFTPGAEAAMKEERARKAPEFAAIEASLGPDAQRFKQINNRVRKLIVELGGGMLDGVEFISDSSNKLLLSDSDKELLLSIEFPEEVFEGFSKDYLEFLELAKLSEGSVIHLEKGQSLEELMTKMEKWATEWEHWSSREIKRVKELGSVAAIRSANPFPASYDKLVSTKPDPKFQEEEPVVLQAWEESIVDAHPERRPLMSGLEPALSSSQVAAPAKEPALERALQASDSTSPTEEPVSQKPIDPPISPPKKFETEQEEEELSDSLEVTQGDASSLQQDEPSRNFYTHFYQEQQTAPKLSELAVSSIESRARAMDVAAFQKAASAWQDKISEKSSADPKYQNVRCELFDQNSMKTTVQFSRKRFQVIEHVYNQEEGCPKVDISDPPEDQTIFLFIESSQAMAPLTLQTPCSKETALKLIEASLLTGVEVNVGAENLQQLSGDERYEKLMALEKNLDALKKFRETVAKQSDYRLGEMPLPEPEPASKPFKPSTS